MPASAISQGFIDFSGEKSHTRFYVPEITAGTFNSSNASAQAIQGAIAALTLCNFTTLAANVELEVDTPVAPSDPQAQRESGLWVQYVDDVTGRYQDMVIPAPDLTLVAQANTDEVDIASNIAAAAFIAIFEANARSYADNAVTVTRMRIIGRRN